LLRPIKAGTVFVRLYLTRHPDPLGFGYGRSRFSDPTGKAFGVVYAGSTLKVAFNEVVLRDRGDGRSSSVPIPLAELEALTCADIEVVDELRLVDLTGDGPLRMGVPSDVVGARDHSLAQVGSSAFHAHRDMPDGAHNPSRLNEERNVALYDRSLVKMRAKTVCPLLSKRRELARLINEFDLAII
jgi:hypothetical protein